MVNLKNITLRKKKIDHTIALIRSIYGGQTDGTKSGRVVTVTGGWGDAEFIFNSVEVQPRKEKACQRLP